MRTLFISVSAARPFTRKAEFPLNAGIIQPPWPLPRCGASPASRDGLTFPACYSGSFRLRNRSVFQASSLISSTSHHWHSGCSRIRPSMHRRDGGKGGDSGSKPLTVFEPTTITDTTLNLCCKKEDCHHAESPITSQLRRDCTDRHRPQ